MSRLDELLGRLDAIGRRLADLRFDAVVVFGLGAPAPGIQPAGLDEEAIDGMDDQPYAEVADLLRFVEARDGLTLRVVEIMDVMEVGMGAFDSDIHGDDLEAVITAAIDQVVAARGA